MAVYLRCVTLLQLPLQVFSAFATSAVSQAGPAFRVKKHSGIFF